MKKGRFIPAGAGNSCRGCRRWKSACGSSPLARGTVTALGNDLAQPRFIPAGAGNRASPVGLPSFTPVHPRWRGEQLEMPFL